MQPKLIPLQNVAAHEGEVVSIVLGKRTGIVFGTGGDDKTFSLWSMGTSTPHATFGPFPSPVTSAQFDQTEELIACGMDGGTVVLFDLANSKMISSWSPHRTDVRSIAFSPVDESLLASCGYDGRVCLLQRGHRQPVKIFKKHTSHVNAVAFSPDGNYLASGGSDKTVRVYDLKTNKEIACFQTHSASVTCLDFHPTEPILVSGGSDRSMYFYDLSTLTVLSTSFPLTPSDVTCVRFVTGVNAAVAVCSELITIVGWKPAQVFERIPISVGTVHDICVIDGNIVVASSVRNHAQCYRLKTMNLRPFNEQRTPSRKSTPEVPHSEPSPPPPQRLAPAIQKEVDKSAFVSEGLVYQAFRKERSPFMSSMNEKYAHLTRFCDHLSEDSLQRALEYALSGSEPQPEILRILMKKSQALKFEYAHYIIEMADRNIERDPELAVQAVELMTQSFGYLASAIANLPAASNVDIALEERKKNSQLFITALKNMYPKLRALSNENSKLGQRCSSVLQQWKVLFR